MKKKRMLLILLLALAAAVVLLYADRIGRVFMCPPGTAGGGAFPDSGTGISAVFEAAGKYVLCSFGASAAEQAEETGESRKVTFRCRAGEAGKVLIAGEFNDWQPEAMAKTGDVWEDTKLLPSGSEYAYQFLIDGVWAADAGNPLTLELGNRGSASLLPKDITELYAKTPPVAVTKTVPAPSVRQPAPAEPVAPPEPVEEETRLWGKVVNERKIPLPKVTIKISLNGSEYVRILTGEDGDYRIDGLPYGTYEIKAWKEKHLPKTVTVELRDGTLRGQHFTLVKRK